MHKIKQNNFNKNYGPVILEFLCFVDAFQRVSTPEAPCLDYCSKRIVKTKQKSSAKASARDLTLKRLNNAEVI